MERQKHILVIEDNPLICELLVAILQGEYRVSIAAEGQVGLDQAIENPPDAILCDVVMPGLHGTQVAEKLKAHPATANIPIALMSGYGDALQPDGAISAPFLQKPFRPDEVLQVIDAMLGTSR
jgi:pilus assembly protein CpaE